MFLTDMNDWNFTLLTHNSTSLGVTWLVPRQHRTVNASVRLIVTEQTHGSRSVSSATNVEKLVDMSSEEAVLSGLLPWYLYRVQFSVLLLNKTEIDFGYFNQFTDQSGEKIGVCADIYILENNVLCCSSIYNKEHSCPTW